MGPVLRSLMMLAAFGAAAALSALSCTAVDDQQVGGAGGGCVGPSCNPEDAGRDQIVADVPVPDSPPDSSPPTLSELCGTSGVCTPDDPNPMGCSPAGAEPPGVDASVAEAGDADPGEAGPDAGVPPPPKYGCGVQEQGGKPVASCQPAGSGESGSPCVAQSDCVPGLACVAEGSTASCRPYCCSELTQCAKGTFCAERPMKGATPLNVPVCIPADDCSLDEPYPCPAGKKCKCKPGTACAVVKDDGTTSCLVPGQGRAGETCPCAAGYVCSKSINTCLKLCSTASSGSECGSGKCLSVPGLPDGFGICGLGSLGDGG